MFTLVTVFFDRHYITDAIFPAPNETKKYRCLATIESDAEHRGKEYKDFMSESQKYMNARQYLILFLQRIKLGQKLDVKGWTKLSSRVGGYGNPMDASWNFLSSELKLGSDVTDIFPAGGPRAIYPM